MHLFTSLTKFMQEYGFGPSKKMGQNFVIDESIVQKIVNASRLKKTDTVLEIGCGTGFLTEQLLKNSSVIGIELDSVLCKILGGRFGKEIGEKKLVLVEGSFSNVEISGFNKVACLPPYSLSSEIMFRLASLHDAELMVFVFQREFVAKCVAEEGFSKYGAISALLGYYFDSQVIEWNISPESFFPKPASFSSLVVFSRKKNVELLKPGFEPFLKNIFRYKNKKLSNALEKAYPFLKKQLNYGKKEFDLRASKLGFAKEKVSLVSPKQFAQAFEIFYP
ncbi:MAG: 16S rRNA (adenine(1518)-N(6)/adenine(1519)-N(6))-dimethyltransferase RsmA [archaeon]|nr:16S rRNA (adenine(1518)-N(6)/adenine(1519)-N(6))-dimethyltransferase RsmA [archaeon]